MKHLVRSVAALWLLVLLGWGTAPRALAQVRPTVPADTTRALTVVTPAEKKSKAAADSAKRTERLFGLRLTRPAKAGLLAAVLPGAGQVYNKSWWKLPLVYGALGAVGGLEYHYQIMYREYVDGYEARTDNDPATQDKGRLSSQEPSVAAVQSGIQFYRGRRDIFILYCGLAYGLQVLDAVVDAHLRDFDVSDDLSLHWQPTLLPVPGRALALPTAPGISLALRMK
jgi:hypothetical protein